MFKAKDFELERWLSFNGEQSEINLAGALNIPFKLQDVVDQIDFDAQVVYGNTQGSSQLRNMVAQLFSEQVKENMVLITAGTCEANYIIMNYLIEEGDEFITFLPTYMQNYGLADALGAKVNVCNLDPENNFRPDLKQLKQIVSPKTKAIHFTNPNNPTGSKFYQDEVEEICEIARSVDAYVIADEALKWLEIDNTPLVSPVDIYQKGVVTGSLSKIGFPGLRIGWAITDEKIIKDCWAYKDYTTLSHSGFSEFLATEVLKEENLAKYKVRVQKVIDEHLAIFSEWIEKHSDVFTWVKPVAGNTAFPRFNLDMDSITFAQKLLDEFSVLVTPGDYFKTPKRFRIRYGCDRETLVEGLERIDRFLAKNK